ncbi:hypothetical protein EV421DRAFT_1738441 [Armillaria borealis]|uniref:Uncharacterized protein n=1 Tax=Armillaria borealis TaxID=47425 RepID=A0AA39J990_9AGAR|nr:hypothetical protein EV421DRAFT_1738441 [Armillaria borealis]
MMDSSSKVCRSIQGQYLGNTNLTSTNSKVAVSGSGGDRLGSQGSTGGSVGQLSSSTERPRDTIPWSSNVQVSFLTFLANMQEYCKEEIPNLEAFETQDFIVESYEDYEDTDGSLRVLGIFFSTMRRLHIELPAPPASRHVRSQ